LNTAGGRLPLAGGMILRKPSFNMVSTVFGCTHIEISYCFNPIFNIKKVYGATPVLI
jgi:hypothetical protein